MNIALKFTIGGNRWIGYYGCLLPVWFGYSILVDIMSDTRRFSVTELMRLNTPTIEESTEYQDYVDYESLLDEMYSRNDPMSPAVYSQVISDLHKLVCISIEAS